MPAITTVAISAINVNSAISGGTISDDGGDSITTRGICWGIIAHPDINSNHTTDGAGTGTFSSAITGLNANTTYYVRAYATNSAGTAYGNELTFVTTAVPTLPDIITTAAYSIASSTTMSGGTINNNGGSAITISGVCWSTSPNPTLANPHTTDGKPFGPFASWLTNLNETTTYYIRAYATNSLGTGYGNELTFTTAASDKYVAGWELNAANIAVAKIWKNGVPTALTDGTNNAAVLSVYVSGKDVYATGYESRGSNDVAILWKNGVRTDLTDPAIHAKASGNCVVVSGANVYVAGSMTPSSPNFYQAVVWKNGVATPLSGGFDGGASGLCVVGADVYVCGNEYNVSGKFAKIWKNGVATSLTNGVNYASALSVAVVGNTVYASGYENSSNKSVATYWKNGFPYSLALVNNNSNANGLAIGINGTNVYAAGYKNNGTTDIAMLWKNSLDIPLTNGANDARANAVCTRGTDVFVCGIERFNGLGSEWVAKYWKNGVPVSLTGGSTTAVATCIFVDF